MVKQSERTIRGAVAVGDTIYTAGREDALAVVLPAASVARLVARGVLMGEWERADLDALPAVAKLGDHLAQMTDADAVRAMQARDDRVSAQKLYDARLDELGGA